MYDKVYHATHPDMMEGASNEQLRDRYLVGGLSKVEGALIASATWVNGEPGIRMELDGQLVGVVSVTIESGRVTRVYSIANPDKLSRLDVRTALSR